MRTATVLLVALSILGCSRPANMRRADVLVTLNGSVNEVEGLSWEVVEGAPLRSLTRELDSPVTIRLPSKREVRLWAKLLIAKQKEGLIETVSVCPLPEAVTLPEAVARLEEIAERLGIRNNRRVDAALARWKEQGLKFNGSTGCSLDPHVDVFVELKVNPDTDAWYIVLTFYYMENQEKESGVLCRKPRNLLCGIGI